MQRTLNGLAAAMLLGAASPAGAAISEGGQPGDPQQVSRTIDIVMYDNYFEPEQLTFAAGETVRLKVRNEGALVHEFNIGTAAMHEAHQGQMQMMVDHGVIQGDHLNHERMKMDMGGGHTMEHSHANSLLLEIGRAHV